MKASAFRTTAIVSCVAGVFVSGIAIAAWQTGIGCAGGVCGRSFLDIWMAFLAVVVFDLLVFLLLANDSPDAIYGIAGAVISSMLFIAQFARRHICLPCLAMDALLLVSSVSIATCALKARKIGGQRLILHMTAVAVICLSALQLLGTKGPGGSFTPSVTVSTTIVNIGAFNSAGEAVTLAGRPVLVFSYFCSHCGDVLDEVAKMPAGERPILLNWGNYSAGDVAKTRDDLARHGLAGSECYYGYLETEGLPAIVMADGSLVTGSGQIIDVLKGGKRT